MNGSEIFISLKTRGMQGRNGGAEEDRTPDLRIAKPTFTPTVTFNQKHTHYDPTRMRLMVTQMDRNELMSVTLRSQ